MAARREFTDPVHVIEYLRGRTSYSLDRIASIVDEVTVRRTWQGASVQITYDGLKYAVTPRA